jgi:heavy metal sensor kinase
LFFRSIRFRLTLWYAFTLAAILAASGLFWHVYLDRNLQGHLDEKLMLIAEDVATFHLAPGNGAEGKGEGKPEAEACVAMEAFIRVHNWGEYVQILDQRGSIECSSSNLDGFHLPLGKEALQASGRGEFVFEQVHLFRPYSVRLLTYPVAAGHIIQVAASMAPLEETLREFRVILMTFSPLALLGLSLGGWFLAGRALSPVVRLTRAARRINAENLNQRLPVENSRDEIAHLAETFNAMLARLESSFRKIKQFSGDASHELRTPLTILRGETEVALRWAKTPEEFRKMLESNMEEIDRMGRIIEDLLLLAKSEAGGLPMERKEFSLSDMLQDLYMQGRILGEPKGIEVLLDMNVAEEIRIRGDELRIRQMLLNLIVNGIKYTPAGEGRLAITLSLEGDDVSVAIADSGIGIPEEHLPHIFDRFYRIDEARNRENGGTGLGLAIVKWIVEAHEGKIQVRSTPGEGSIFTVLLPIQGPSIDPRGKG